jgi:hypothetical protein
MKLLAWVRRAACSVGSRRLGVAGSVKETHDAAMHEKVGGDMAKRLMPRRNATRSMPLRGWRTGGRSYPIRPDRFTVWIRAMRPVIIVVLSAIVLLVCHYELVRLVDGVELTLTVQQGQFSLKKVRE